VPPRHFAHHHHEWEKMGKMGKKEENRGKVDAFFSHFHFSKWGKGKKWENRGKIG